MENSVTPPAIRSETGKTGMLAFTIIWIGQMFSLLGTAMTQFALTIWAWGADWASYSSCFGGLLWFGTARSCQSISRRNCGPLRPQESDDASYLAAGLPTVVVLMLYVSGNLQIWHLYVTGAFSGTFQAFHFPAYSAAVTMMLPKKQYGRPKWLQASKAECSRHVCSLPRFLRQ
jgi:DHA3 family macrolide efflux protein-like MFS transporter